MAFKLKNLSLISNATQRGIAPLIWQYYNEDNDSVISNDYFATDKLKTGDQIVVIDSNYSKNTWYNVTNATSTTVTKVSYSYYKTVYEVSNGGETPTVGYVSVSGSSGSKVEAGIGIYADADLSTFIENCDGSEHVYTGNTDTMTNPIVVDGYVKATGTVGSYVNNGLVVYQDSNCTKYQATTTGSNYKFTSTVFALDGVSESKFTAKANS